MDPVRALERIAFLLERELAESHRVRAYRGAARHLAALPPGELERRIADGALTELPGIGPSTARVAAEAAAGRTPTRLAELEVGGARPVAPGGERVRSWLRGDLHAHSDWSDGTAGIAEMARTAADLGHDYLALTDHSPRLTVARGLSPQRLREQLDVVSRLNAELAPFRILTGIEVDILEDGSLDQEPELLERLDVVVASVHSHLRMPAPQMTRRMVTAVAHPRVDVLGHCTGRLVAGSNAPRPPSTFDADLVLEACRRFGTAVEVNSRPERRDPPTDLLRRALDVGCLLAVDTDAHAPGQLDLLDHGCARLQALDVDRSRIVNTLPLGDLLAWTAEPPRADA